MNEPLEEALSRTAAWLRESQYTVVFTGAGISVESGIPPFRGPNGLWTKYDPRCIEINYFLQNPRDSWRKMKEIFFDSMEGAQPNTAHLALARFEEAGYVHWLITQNIDFLHQRAGSTKVTEFHGSIGSLHCLACGMKVLTSDLSWEPFPPVCQECGSIIKPDFVFFGEDIPEKALSTSFSEAEKAELMLIIGTAGEVVPAAMLPTIAKRKGARIVEINLAPSRYTEGISDIFLQGSAAAVMSRLEKEIDRK